MGMRASAGWAKPVGSGDVVRNAWKAGLVVPAFHVTHWAMFEPIVRAVTELDSFAFIATSCLDWAHSEVKGLKPVWVAFRESEQYAYVHLHLAHVPAINRAGHATRYLDAIQQAVEIGYGSIMIDGSRLPLDDNIRVSTEAVEIVHAKGIPCEAELGPALARDGSAPATYDDLCESGRAFTVVEQARRFVEETRCDWLAVSIGNMHGAVAEAVQNEKVTPRLNIERLEMLRDAACVPLVLHGAAGLSRDDIRRAIRSGVAKVNVDTAIRQTYERSLSQTGSLNTAQEDLYEHLCWLIQDYYETAGTHSVMVGD